RSALGVTEAILLDDSQVSEFGPRDELAEFVAPLFDAAASSPPTDNASLALCYAAAITNCVTAWRDDTMTDDQARFLNTFVSEKLLTNRFGQYPELERLVHEYRAVESNIPVPTRAPGVIPAEVLDQPL